MKKNKVFKFEVNNESFTKIIVYDNHLTIHFKELNNYYIRWIPIKEMVRLKIFTYNDKVSLLSFYPNKLKDKSKLSDICYPYEIKYQNIINRLIKTINNKMELLCEKD